MFREIPVQYYEKWALVSQDGTSAICWYDKKKKKLKLIDSDENIMLYKTKGSALQAHKTCYFEHNLRPAKVMIQMVEIIPDNWEDEDE